MNGSSIRIAGPDDADEVAAIYAPAVAHTAISFEIDPPSAEEMRRRIETTMPAHPWLVSADHDVVTGYAYGSTHRARAAYQWSADVSVYVHESYRGRGVGAALYVSLLRLLEAQGFYTLYAGITLPNPASVRLHESFGFRPLVTYRDVGFKAGRWHDVGWWELTLRQAAGEPERLRSLQEVAAEELAEALAAGTRRLRR